MTEINTGTSGLGSKLQAQLQPARGEKAEGKGLNLTPSADDIIEIRRRRQAAELKDNGFQTPASRKARVALSSSTEIEEAGERVSQLKTSNREAPVGRLSEQTGVHRNVPLGQIVDIRV